MGNSIQEESGIPCVCNDFTGEVLRGIRMHATRFMKDLEESDMNKVSSASRKDLPASSMPQSLLWLKNMHVAAQKLHICSYLFSAYSVACKQALSTSSGASPSDGTLSDTWTAVLCRAVLCYGFYRNTMSHVQISNALSQSVSLDAQLL